MYPKRVLICKFRMQMLAYLQEVPINHHANHLYHINQSQELNLLQVSGVIWVFIGPVTQLLGKWSSYSDTQLRRQRSTEYRHAVGKQKFARAQRTERHWSPGAHMCRVSPHITTTWVLQRFNFRLRCHKRQNRAVPHLSTARSYNTHS
jgi:hypothetical protein